MKGVVTENTMLNEKYGLMSINSKEFVDSAKPGQFVMIKAQPHDYIYDPLLRRPLGICDTNKKNGVFSLLYMLVGKGTKLLSAIKAGTELNFSEPLGMSFSNVYEKKVAIAGGGIGIAPMIFLTKMLNENNEVDVYYGGFDKNDILLPDIFEKYSDNLYITTDNGSVGEKGFVTDTLRKNINNYDNVYACGPKQMLKATHGLISESNKEISLEVSLEERMACGIGACLGCIIYLKENDNSKKQVRCCVEGPVFDGNKILWDTTCKE